MAAKNTSNSKTRGEAKNVKVHNKSEMPAAVVLSGSAEKSAVLEEQDSLYYEKGLQLSDEHLNEVKFETNLLNKADSILGNKSSTPSAKILKTRVAAVSTPTDTTVKKESNEEESLSNVPVCAPTPVKPAKIVFADEVKSNNIADGNQALSGLNIKESGVIRLAAKNLSDEERKKLRAKRFNIIVVDSCQIAKKDVTNKVSTPQVQKSTSSFTDHPTPTYEILKKRADRFGENVSTMMKSLDYKEKMLKRKLKFLESVTNLKELEIKKRRADRFRMI